VKMLLWRCETAACTVGKKTRSRCLPMNEEHKEESMLSLTMYSVMNDDGDGEVEVKRRWQFMPF